MVGYLRNYPARTVRSLRRLVAAAIICLAAILGIGYLAVFTRTPFEVAAVLPFLLFVFLFYLVPASLSTASRTRIVPILRWQPRADGRPAPAPLHGAYLRHRTLGRAIARNYRLLAASARDRGIPTIEEFGQADVYSRDIPYYEASRPVEPLRRLLEILRASPPGGAWRLDEAIDEIEKILAILEEASRNRTQVCFAIF